LAIVSPATRDGRSSVAANLAVALSTSWKNVVLLDADLRCPSLHNYFDLDNRIGLSSPRMQWLIDHPKETADHLKETADVVLVDTPPLLVVTDGVILRSQLEGVVLVVNGPNCRVGMIRTVSSYLEKVCFSIWGYVWNGRKSGEFWNYSEAGRFHRRPKQDSLGRSPLEASSLLADSNSLANGSRASETTPQ
jgi:Mrp family chromosome partitioning ATPase